MRETSAHSQAPAFAPRFAGAEAYTLEAPQGARLYLDRPLPFVVLHRKTPGAGGLSLRVASISPAGLVWNGQPADDADALAWLEALLSWLDTSFTASLVGSLYDLPSDERIEEDSPRLERFRFLAGTSPGKAAHAASLALAESLAALCLDDRSAKVEPVEAPFVAPGVAEVLQHHPAAAHLSLGIPQVYRVPHSERTYPQVFESLASGVFDALLKAFAAFIGASGAPAPHPRSLGRSSFVEAAVAADEALDGISRSFDFLLGVSPINSADAFAGFMAGKARTPPVFRYRPLSVDVDEAKRAVYSIDLRAVEDPVLESIFREKQHELDLQLTLLRARNTPDFRHGSLMLYGGVDAALLQLAEAVLEGITEHPGDGKRLIGAPRIKEAAEALVLAYQQTAPGFGASVEVRDDIGPGLMVSGTTLLVSSATRMPATRLDALLQHEVSVHVLTCVNGRQQGLQVFGNGLAAYEGIQEGLGVFAEYAAGGLTRARMRLLAARVVAVHAMLQGADFIETWRLLRDRHGFQAQTAFSIATRVHRSGGLTKDAIYLRGMAEVFDLVGRGQDLTPFWCGKIAPRHIPVVDDLRARGILRAPLVVPQFLSRPDSQARIARIADGVPFIDLLRG
jgi:uncharacterized protein (TIGR02421 family)